jgi:hypothetical protein
MPCFLFPDPLGEVALSFTAVLEVAILQLLSPLGVGLLGLCKRLVLDELRVAPAKMEPFDLTLTAESSLLIDGLSDLVSSLLLLCRWLCPGR